MYKKHYDHLRGGWNVFFMVGEKEDFDRWFEKAFDAQKYCDDKNEVAVKVEVES